MHQLLQRKGGQGDVDEKTDKAISMVLFFLLERLTLDEQGGKDVIGDDDVVFQEILLFGYRSAK